MIGLALSGGGSRAIAFHLGCLRALDDLGLLQRLNVLSTISGGSVIGAYYAYTPNLTFEAFETDMRVFLRTGFERALFAQLLRPPTFIRSVRNVVNASIDVVTERVLKHRSKFRESPGRTDLFRYVLQQKMFTGLKMSSPRRQFEVVIGACDLRTGSAFGFGNSKSGSWRLGEVVDGDVDVALAVAASAAYPLLLPTLDREWKFRKAGLERNEGIQLTDGGIYDNLGVQVLEPDRPPAFTFHTCACDYLIVCNAGHGQFAGESVPARLLPRLSTAFAVTHRQVQDAAMHRLHHLREAKIIKGFALPYLGQQDDALPWQPSQLVPRSKVIAYPTDFKAMSEESIDTLSDRGEQLTRVLVSHYLSRLLEPS